ncbi:MAG TPA: ectonucleotide pyrophosphatase/phosphodiesterase [Methylomirabilota bacterium]|nr:ectonucleotide pyrophosphatase/phosphodiesterase [Methylomirabilota bacterium]
MIFKRAAWVSLFGLLAAAACTHTAPPVAPDIVEAAPPQRVLLIGLDGFRPEMLGWDSPNLAALAARGVRAESMIPVMPSVTFVNFYAIATGLYPEHNGMVANYPYDAKAKEYFQQATGPQEERWWQGEPIWITAEKQGLKTAIMFWLGSEVAHDGVRPQVWTPYQHEKPYPERIAEVLAWYDAPEAERPRFAAVYFDRVDTVTHYTGPNSDTAKAAVTEVDDYVGQLIAGLEARGLLDSTTVMVVSDHGMAYTPPEQVLDVGALIDLDQLVVSQFAGPYGGSGHPFLQIYGDGPALEAAYAGLKDFSEHIKVYRRGEMPAHYHLDHPTRGPDLFAVAGPGWLMRSTNVGGWRPPIPGNHGYDNLHPSMSATFLAAGPIFPQGQVAAPFENVNVYGLIACALGIMPAETDGDPSVVEQITDGRCPPPTN